jgi:chromosomal replication initiator protein
MAALSCWRATSRPPLIEQLDDRMRDEVHGGVIAQMELPERNLRREILRAKADCGGGCRHRDRCDFRPRLKSGSTFWPTACRRRAGRSAGRCATSIAARSSSESALDRPAVEKAIQLQAGGSPARAPKIDTIKDVTARAYGVTKAELESACRKRQYALPRQYAMYLSRQLTKCSYPQIGRMFGDRDHTTVLFAYRKICGDDRLETMHGRRGTPPLEQRILADPRNGK